MKTPQLMITRFTAFAILVFIQIGSQAQYMAENSEPPTLEELFDSGEQAYRGGDRAKAIGYYDRVLAQDPQHINALLQRGFCHSLLKHYDKAVVDFTNVIKQKNEHIWAYTSRGSAYAKLDKQELAIADFNKVIALDPKNHEAYNNRGWARKANGDLKAACKDWTESKKLGNDEAKIILKNNRCR